MEYLRKIKERYDNLNSWAQNVVVWTLIFAVIGVLFLVFVNAQTN